MKKYITSVLFLLFSFIAIAQNGNITVAGYDSTTARPGYKYVLKPTNYQYPFRIVNDTTIAMWRYVSKVVVLFPGVLFNTPANSTFTDTTLTITPTLISQANNTLFSNFSGASATPIFNNVRTTQIGLQTDTVTLAAFGGGGGNAGDTTSFNTSTIYGSFFNSLSDTLVITNLRIGLQGTSPNVTVRIYWNDSLNITAGATGLTTSGSAATNIYTGTTVTSFANTKIPPGNWVWCTTSAVTTKPTFMAVTLIGYKSRTQ